MSAMRITSLRLHVQGIATPTFETPDEVVRWLGAVQAQDYLGSLWAVGLRMGQATAQVIEQAIAERTILRTWPMRGTLHFVPPAEARWMLKLLARRVVAGNQKRLLKQYGIDEAVIARSREAFLSALQGGRQLTRPAMYQVLEAAGIPAANQRGLHIIWWLAQEGLLCFGGRADKQPTFVLLDEWAPSGRALEGEEALAELARRYFTSHGPATLMDFMWWTGLTKSEARLGLELVRSDLARLEVEEQVYWHAPDLGEVPDSAYAGYLLPPFDEFLVGYTDRRAALGGLYDDPLVPRLGFLLSPTIVVDGQVVGIWKRRINKGAVAVMPDLFRALSKAEGQAVADAVECYGKFLELQVVYKGTR